MRETRICATNPTPVMFWPSSLLRRGVALLRGVVELAIIGVSLFGIALGFAAVSDHEDTMVQSILHAAALSTGLIH